MEVFAYLMAPSRQAGGAAAASWTTATKAKAKMVLENMVSIMVLLLIADVSKRVSRVSRPKEIGEGWIWMKVEKKV